MEVFNTNIPPPTSECSVTALASSFNISRAFAGAVAKWRFRARLDAQFYFKTRARERELRRRISVWRDWLTRAGQVRSYPLQDIVSLLSFFVGVHHPFTPPAKPTLLQYCCTTNAQSGSPYVDASQNGEVGSHEPGRYDSTHFIYATHMKNYYQCGCNPTCWLNTYLRKHRNAALTRANNTLQVTRPPHRGAC